MPAIFAVSLHKVLNFECESGTLGRDNPISSIVLYYNKVILVELLRYLQKIEY
jgi:hypothetical protein